MNKVLYIVRNNFINKITQLSLAKYKDPIVRMRLSLNKNLYKEIKLILTKDKDYGVRGFLAKGNIDKKIQLTLAKDKYRYVRGCLARNKYLDKEVQLILAKDKNKLVRADLAYNSSIDNETILILQNDKLKLIVDIINGNIRYV